MKTSLNGKLHKAKAEKNDEFYTRLEDIESELANYTHHFDGKVVLCNCDDPRESNFFKYFFDNFTKLGLRKLVATCYKNQQWDLFTEKECERAVYIVYDGPTDGSAHRDEDLRVMELSGDGDFSSKECLQFLEDADIVVTNPPFSEFRKFVATMFEYDKKFIILGNFNAITYKEIFPLFKSKRMWVGNKSMSSPMWFDIPRDQYDEFIRSKKPGMYRWHTESECGESKLQARQTNAIWFTNLEYEKDKEQVVLTERYSPEKYPKYDNYDAINVDKVSDIPYDYDGVIGVPISFLDKWNPNARKRTDGIVTTNDFEIVEFRKGLDGKDLVYTERERKIQPYFRILVRRLKYPEY